MAHAPEPIETEISNISPSELEQGRNTPFPSGEARESLSVPTIGDGGLASPPPSIGVGSARSPRANNAHLVSLSSRPRVGVSTLGRDHHHECPPTTPSRFSLPQNSVALSQQGSAGASITDYPVSIPQYIDQHADMWLEYNKMADKEDREFVKAGNENLNTLLIFAGIFASINASFISDALGKQKDHSTDHSREVRTNLAFFSSLCTSLAGSFLAVLGKQWLSNYENEGSLKPPAERARERQRKFEGREKYHLQGVVESLPTLLQVALLVFLAGLADNLWPLDKTASFCVLAFVCIISIAWVSSTIIATFAPRFPYQTRLSIVLRRLALPHQNKEGPRTADQTFAISIRIIGQMLKNAIHSDTKRLNILASCFDTIPPDANIKELGSIMVQFHFAPLLVTAPKPWEVLKNTMIHEEFRSSGMLRIVRGLIKHTGSLELGVREAILSRVYLLSWQTELDGDSAQAVADIIALDVDRVEAMRVQMAGDPEWAPPLERHQRQNLEIKLASRLCDRLVENQFQETSRPCLTHFFSCLPEKYSENQTVTRTLNRLAKFYESLPEGDVNIDILGDEMMPALTNDEEFRSAPMLCMINVLLLHHKMKLEVRNSVLSSIWRFSQQEGIRPELAAIMASIIAQHLIQLEDLVRNDLNLSCAASFNHNQRRHLGVHLVSYLCNRLVEEKLDKYASASCLNLLYRCLPNHYATDPTFTKPLSRLADFYEPLPKDDLNISVLASATKFCLSVDAGSKASARAGDPEVPGQTSRNKFRSVPMLRIIYTLLHHSILEAEVHESILSHVWSISQHTPVGPDQAEVIAKIIALGVKKVDKLHRSTPNWRSSLSPSQYRNMSVALASQWASELESKPLDGDATRSWMYLICDSLDTQFLSAILGKLAGKLFALTEVDDASVKILAEKIKEIWLNAFVAEESTFLQQDAEGLQMIPTPTRDEFRSVPMLKVLYVLLRGSALESEVRKCILARIWRLSKQNVAEPQAVEVFADIIALEAVEVEKLRSSYMSSSWVGVSSTQQRNLGMLLQQRLNIRLENSLDEVSKTSCFGLLCDCLPEDFSNNPPLPSPQRYLNPQLASLYESLPPNHPSIRTMANRLSKIYFNFLHPAQQLASQRGTQSASVLSLGNEGLRSVTLLRIFLVLIRHEALPQSTRRTVLSHIWALSQEDLMDSERARLTAEIITVEAVETMGMLDSCSDVSFSPAQFRTLSVPLAFQLHSALVKGSSALDSRVARLTLLFNCLPKSLSEETAAQVLDIHASFIRFLVAPLIDEVSIRTEFQLVPVLRMILALFTTPRLETEVIERVLSIIWDISHQDVMNPEISRMVAEIIASKSKEIAKLRKLRSPLQFRGIGSLDVLQYRNIGPQLASLLCDLLVSGGLSKVDTASSLDLFWSCLTRQSLSNDTFAATIAKLSAFYESLPINDTRIQYLAESMTAFETFANEETSLVGEGDHVSLALSSGYEELLSVPMLRIIAVLFQSSFLKNKTRKAVLTRIWWISYAGSLDPEQAEIVGRIATMEASEVEIIRKASSMPKTPEGRVLRRRNVSLALASNLCKRLTREYPDCEARSSCLDLFYHSLPPKFSQDNLVEILDWLADPVTFPPVPSQGVKFRVTAILQLSFAPSDEEKTRSWPFIQESESQGSDKGLLLEETRSIPLLRVASSLFQGDSSGLPTHEMMLFQLWEMFWSASTELIRPSLVARIIASGASEIVKHFEITGESSEKYQWQDRSTKLVSSLCSRLSSGRLDLESENFCLNILFTCLPQGRSAGTVLGDSVESLGRFIKSRHIGCESDVQKLSLLQSSPLLRSTLIWLKWGRDREDKYRQLVLLNVWSLSQRYPLQPEMVNLIIEILASNAREVQMMRSCNPSSGTITFHSGQSDMCLRLASRLLNSIVGGVSGEEFKGCLELFMGCVDERIAKDPAFVGLLGSLADFYETLPIADEKLEALGDMYTDVDEDLPAMLEKKLAERIAQSTVVAHSHIFEETPLFPLVRIYRVLLRSSTYSQPIARSNCIVDIWLYMARGDMRIETSEILADAIVAGARETTQLLKQFPSLLSFGLQHHPRTAVVVASRLNSKLKDGGLTDEIKQYISELLDIFVVGNPVV